MGVEGRVIDPTRVDVKQGEVVARPKSFSEEAARLFACWRDDLANCSRQRLLVS